MDLLSRLLYKKRNIFFILLLWGFLVYFPVMTGPFIFDDDLFIVNNKQLHSLANIPQLFISSTSDRAIDVNSNFYRPLQQVTYAFLYALFGANPMPFHLLSILLHIVNSFLLFILFTKLISKKEAAFFASLLFLLHPINTEAVCYISGLADLLGMFFLLGCMILTREIVSLKNNSKTYFSLAVFSFVLALLSKENMVILFPLSLLLYYYCNNSIRQNELKLSVSPSVVVLGIIYLGFSVTYVTLKLTVFDFTGNAGLTNEKNIYTENLYVRLLSFIHIIPEYIRMLFLPIHLNYEKPYTAFVSLKSVQSVLGLLIVLGISGALFFSYRKKNKIVFFSLAWIVISMIPFSGIIPLNAIYLEHWLYVPLVGFCLLVAVLMSYTINFQKVLMTTMLVPILILCSFRTSARAVEWADIEKFYLSELKYTQDAVRIYNNLAMYYADHKKPQKALYYYQKAVQIKDVFPQVHHNMGNLYRDMGELNKAIEEYYKALSLNPNFYYSLAQMVNLCLDHKLEDRAVIFRQLYERASSKADVRPEEIEKAFSSK